MNRLGIVPIGVMIILISEKPVPTGALNNICILHTVFNFIAINHVLRVYTLGF